MKRIVTSAPSATARLVVTMPPEPSCLSAAIAQDVAHDYVTLTPTHDAFTHLAFRAKEHLNVMIPYIDDIGADWASEMFESTPAATRILILRGTAQLATLKRRTRERLESCVTSLIPYGSDSSADETFHAKIVLADGTAAYVGSANLLTRSRHTNFECGFLVEGAAVQGVKMLVDAVSRMGSG